MSESIQPTRGFAEVNGAKLYYEVMGAGHPLVLLHEGIADSRMYDDQFNAFAQRYRVVRFDLRGFGQSDLPPGDEPVALYEDLYGLLALLGIKKTYVLGMSMGGAIALDFTLAHPVMVDALILVAPGVSGYDMTSGGTYSLVEDQLHFNVNALQRPLPFGTTFSTNGVLAPGSTGNLGNVPWGALRNPGWSNWDFTLSRRFPVKWSDSHTGNIRVQLQFYNVFNQVEFNRLGAIYAFTSANATGGFGGGNTNTQTGKYVDTQPPFNGGITIRFDF